MSDLIPQTAPGRKYLEHRHEIDEAVARVLVGGSYILGSEVGAFEAEFASYLGVEDAVGVGNGTDALELALRALGIGPGDAVFTVSHTAVATIVAIESAGATPVLVDIDPATFLMDPNRLERAVRSSLDASDARPAAVVPVHLYGQVADMPAILQVAANHGLRVVEDCAQAHGARLNGKLAGTWGEAASFSFYPTKNLGAFGDGGMVVTTRPGLGERVRELRQYGWTSERESVRRGRNSRLDELQASVLRVGLRHLETDNRRRQAIAAQYDRLGSKAISPPAVVAGAEHVYHQYVVRSPQRDDLRDRLTRDGIGSAIHYPVPVHLQPVYRGSILGSESLPETESAAKEIVSLPMFADLSDGEVERVVASVSSWAASK